MLNFCCGISLLIGYYYLLQYQGQTLVSPYVEMAQKDGGSNEHIAHVAVIT